MTVWRLRHRYAIFSMHMNKRHYSAPKREKQNLRNFLHIFLFLSYGPRQANWVLIAYASSEDSGEPAHPRSLARTFAARSYKQWFKRNLQTESQIPGPAEWLGMRSWNLSWQNARRHKFAWRGSYEQQASQFWNWPLSSKDITVSKLTSIQQRHHSFETDLYPAKTSQFRNWPLSSRDIAV